jgi:ABC-2 type transport system ATP-binding protein
MAEPAVLVEGIGKRFKRYREKPATLKERLIRFRQTSEDFWALRDLDVTVGEGDTLGLIGPNGSGKTTLLKLIAGILRPTEGRITARGRIAALLALGAGFHPELTGRENVYLNASILGLTRAETDRLFDEIVQFAELEDFVDTQVKFYSSGMYVRLGFAVAVHVDPAILLVDEVLAVGDIAFQRKCLDKVEEFQRDGRTIVFVTHAPDLVTRVCDRVVLLDHGRIRNQGTPEEVVRDFRLLMTRQDMAYAAQEGTREVEIVSTDLFGSDGESRQSFEPGDELIIQLDLRASHFVDQPVVSFALHDDQNQFVFGTNTDWRGMYFDLPEGKHRLQFVLPSIPMVGGRYYVSVGVHSRDARATFHTIQQAVAFDVLRGSENPGAVFIPVECRFERL